MLEFAEVIMKSPKETTNAEFMQQLMNYSPFGGLIQPYIISCISAYSQDTINRKGSNNPMKGFVTDEVWLGMAEDIQNQMDAKYGRKEEEKLAPHSNLVDRPTLADKPKDERKSDDSTTTTTSGGTEAGINE